MLPIKKIIAPTDFSDASKAGIKAAVELAGKYNAMIYIVYVMTPLPMIMSGYSYMGGPGALPANMEGIAQEAKNAMQALAENDIPENIHHATRILEGRAADEIVRLAKEVEADLIAIATHGESGWHHFLFGSVAERVVRMAECPVLTVHPPKPEVAEA